MNEYIKIIKSTYAKDSKDVFRLSGVRFAMIITDDRYYDSFHKAVINNSSILYNTKIPISELKETVKPKFGVVNVSGAKSTDPNNVVHYATQLLKEAKNQDVYTAVKGSTKNLDTIVWRLSVAIPVDVNTGEWIIQQSRHSKKSACFFIKKRVEISALNCAKPFSLCIKMVLSTHEIKYGIDKLISTVFIIFLCVYNQGRIILNKDRINQSLLFIKKMSEVFYENRFYRCWSYGFFFSKSD